ncbi:MAG TPA: tetratricopeptide repeat protein, partial [Herpetosiphonaceae bacterium]
LVLDNAEHLLDACAQLADGLLRRCEKLSVLITSREHLGVAGELAYRVPSLSLPDPQQEVTLETIAASEAARLFIDRARLQQPQFDVTPGNAAVLAAVCRRLDGIALALELAAPRVRSMSMQELSQRLDDRFGMLQQGARVALPRHRTLRSLIDWSYDLLDARERVLLQRVSVFAGGWTLAAAEQVCSGDDLPADAVLDRLTSLVDKNMVQADTREGETRYGLLETVRQYAGDHLRESGLEASIQDRLLNYVAALTSAMELQSRTTDQLAAIRCLEAEIDNVRAALSRALMPGGDVAAGLRTAIAACWFFETRGRASEGASWLSSLLAAAPTDLDKAERATALRWVGTFAFRQGDYAAAAAHREQGLALWKELGNQDNVSLALAGLGMIALARGDHDAARGFFTDGLAIARTCGNERRVHNLLIQLAHTAGERGDFATAHAHLEESLPIAQRLGSLQMNESLYHLGMVSYYQGDYPAARVCLHESLV